MSAFLDNETAGVEAPAATHYDTEFPAADAPVAEAPVDPAVVVPDPPRDEVERLDPAPTGPVTLSNGSQVEVNPLKLRETMKLLKVVTRGAGGVLEQLLSEVNLEDPAAFAQTFGALILFSIPEAEDEVVEFVRSMVSPVGLKDMDPKARVAAMTELATEFENPHLEDVLSIVERIVRRESEDIRNLGKRVATAFNLMRKVGQAQ